MEGIYIVILFKENMSGFYLCLSQWVTFFNSNYGKIKKELNDRVVKWLRKKIAKLGPFNYDPVRLYDSYEPHLNYEDTNIISKYYEITILIS